MIYRTSSRRNSYSTNSPNDRSEIITENLVIYRENGTNTLTLKDTPRGTIISLVIFTDDGDMVVDGLVNINTKGVTFLDHLDFGSFKAEIKYLVWND